MTPSLHAVVASQGKMSPSQWTPVRPMPSPWHCAPIARSYVAEQVMQSAKLSTSGPPEGPTAEQLRGWLEGLNDEDLGRYKM
jgi:hypothetical protein